MAAKDVVDEAYQAVAAGDIPTFLSLLDDKIEWTEAAGFPSLWSALRLIGATE